METTHARPYSCPQCNRRFTTKLFLKRHFTVHSASRNFKCSLCLSTYKYKKGLNRHIKKFHPEFYITLKVSPFKKKPQVKIDENPKPIFKLRRKTANGVVEEIPPVAPAFTGAKNEDLTLQEEKQVRKPEPFIKFFMQKLSKSRESGEWDKRTYEKQSLDDSLKEFNKVLSENLIEYSSIISEKTIKGEGSKGFVPVMDERSGQRPVSHKKIESLEEMVKDYKSKEQFMNLQLYMERQKQEKIKKRLERMKRLYKLQMLRKRKREIRLRQMEVEVKIEPEED